MKEIIKYDPTNPDHTGQNDKSDSGDDAVYNALYPTLSSLNRCSNNCNKQHSCDDSC